MAGLTWFRAVARAIIVLAIVATGWGCAATRAPLVMTTSFDAGAASFIHEEGRARISGQAFVRRTSGKLLRAVGTDVTLIPRTAYSEERIAALYGDRNKLKWGVSMPGSDPLYAQYMRKTVASSGGSFSFDRVADGDYFVVAMIHLPGEYLSREFPILERVTVKGGRSVRVVMRGY